MGGDAGCWGGGGGMGRVVGWGGGGGMGRIGAGRANGRVEMGREKVWKERQGAGGVSRIPGVLTCPPGSAHGTARLCLYVGAEIQIGRLSTKLIVDGSSIYIYIYRCTDGSLSAQRGARLHAKTGFRRRLVICRRYSHLDRKSSIRPCFRSLSLRHVYIRYSLWINIHTVF